MSKSREPRKPASINDAPEEGSVWELVLFAVFFILVFSTIARADVPPQKSLRTTVVKPVSMVPTIESSLKLLVETARTLNEETAPSFSGVYRMTGTIKHNPTALSLTADVIYGRQYSKENADGTDGNFENPALIGTKAFTREAGLGLGLESLSFSLTGTLPGNREARRRTFSGSLGPSVKAATKFGRFSLSQRFGYSHAFYEFDIRADGTVNSPDNYKSTTEASLKLTEKFSLESALVYSYGVSFQGVGKASQIAQLLASYAFTKNISASIGIATERGTLQPDGQADRILFFEQDTTRAVFDLVIGI